MQRLKRLTVITAVLTVFGLGGWALADDNRVDWDCPGTPSPGSLASICSAYSGANHSYGKVDAINTADAYNKCAGINDIGVRYISVLCAAATEVSTYSTDYGYCAYPNNATSGDCINLSADVWNNTSVQHGLRGVAWY